MKVVGQGDKRCGAGRTCIAKQSSEHRRWSMDRRDCDDGVAPTMWLMTVSDRDAAICCNDLQYCAIKADLPEPAPPQTTASTPELRRILAGTHESRRASRSARPTKNSLRVLMAALCCTRSMSKGVPSASGGYCGKNKVLKTGRRGCCK
jgi:hypothetical protein